MMASPWPKEVQGLSASLVDRLVTDLRGQPMLAAAIVRRVQERLQKGENPEAFCTWNGQDASEALIRALADAILAARQLQLEVSDQVVPSLSEARIVSPRLLEIYTPLLFVEGSLQYALSFAILANMKLWGDSLEKRGVTRG